MGARRIGHGIAMAGVKEIEELCRERGVAVEMCPTSNFQTKAVEKRSDYPIRRFLEQGLAVTVNTDNRTVSGTSMTEELFLLHSQFGVTKDEALRMTENAVLAAFAEEEVKRELLEKLADFRKIGIERHREENQDGVSFDRYGYLGAAGTLLLLQRFSEGPL